MAPVRDVIVAGGGPAGLAAAIAAATSGAEVLVLERRALPADKACGEGILPQGVQSLEALGVLAHLVADGSSALSSIRWIDGTTAAEARLPPPGGLGVRRTALSAALLSRARELGVDVRTGEAVTGHARDREGVTVVTSTGYTARARLLVAADGLGSAIRRREGLAAATSAGPRFGLRRHFAVAPWTSAVEVHFGDGVEAYVTPVGPERVGIAMLCEEWARAPFDDLLGRFPTLHARVASCPYDSALAGAGPFPCRSRARVLDRLVVVGDAGGYLDAITGEGLSLAFQSALGLARVLPSALREGAGRGAFAAWERSEAARFRWYAATARSVLVMARNRAVRRRVLRFLGGHRRLFDGLVGLAVG